MPWRRDGICNMCGQCCGCETAPNRDSPWPNNWPEVLYEWAESDLRRIASFIKTPNHGGTQYGTAQVGTNVYRWIWVPGEGLCKDIPPYGKYENNKFERQCPFLMNSPDGGVTYPCSLYGSDTFIPHLNKTCGELWNEMCGPLPPEILEDEIQVQQWEANHPACSYTYTLIE